MLPIFKFISIYNGAKISTGWLSTLGRKISDGVSWQPSGSARTTAWARKRLKHAPIPTVGQSLPVSHRGNNLLSCLTESGSGSGHLSSLTSLPILLLLRRSLMVALLLLLSRLLWTLLLLSSHVLCILGSLLASWIFWPADTGRFMGSTHLSHQTNLPFSSTEPIGPFKGH